MKTYAQMSSEKGRTEAISTDNGVRFVDVQTKHDIINNWRCAGMADFAPAVASDTGIRRIAVYESPARKIASGVTYDYVLRVDDASIDTLQIVASPLSYCDLVKKYASDDRWIRV